MKHRVAISALAVSAAFVIAELWPHEGWTERAVVPVPGDVPTVGPGLTKRPDGTPVRMGDTVKPLEGAARSLAHIQKDETQLRSCVTAPLTQGEYDVLVGFAYQFGVARVCSSGIVAAINAGNYKAACDGYLKYRFVAGRDCSLPGSTCRGVWVRAQDRQKKCLEAG